MTSVRFGLKMTRSCPSQRAWRKAETVDGRFLRCPCLPASTPRRSTYRLRLGEAPCAVEDFTSWEKESHRVVPPLRDRQAIWHLGVAPAKLDGHEAISALFPRDTVHRIDEMDAAPLLSEEERYGGQAQDQGGPPGARTASVCQSGGV